MLEAGSLVRHPRLDPCYGLIVALEATWAQVLPVGAGPETGDFALDEGAIAPQLGVARPHLDLWQSRRLALAELTPAGTLDREVLDRVLRAMGRGAAKAHYAARHVPGPFVPDVSSVPVSGKCYGSAEMELLVEASFDFWLTTGRFNDLFEKKLAGVLGRRFCLTANSGSSANLLAISALTSPKLGDRRLRPGDEIITVAAGFPTTVTPIIQNGLVPVFLDADPATGNVRPEQLEAAVGPRTRGIFLAHTLGNPFDVAEALRVARKHDLWLVEDCCDALGARYARDGQEGPCGGFGHIATFSFYPAHHITMGEGGAVVTDDPVLSKILVSFRDWGRDCWCAPGTDGSCKRRYDVKFPLLPAGYDHKYVYSHLGYNLKITDMQAAVGLAQLDRLDGFIADRRRNFAFLRDALADLEGNGLILPRPTPGSDPSWFGFLLTLEKGTGDRADLLRRLEAHKIGSRLLFAGNMLCQPCSEGMVHRCPFPLEGTDAILRRSFWIGLYPGLTEAQLAHSVRQLRLWLAGAKS